MLCRFKSDGVGCGWNWYDCRSRISDVTSYTFKTLVNMAFHAEKCCHLVTARAASARRICSSVRQFLMHSRPTYVGGRPTRCTILRRGRLNIEAIASCKCKVCGGCFWRQTVAPTCEWRESMNGQSLIGPPSPSAAANGPHRRCFRVLFLHHYSFVACSRHWIVIQNGSALQRMNVYHMFQPLCFIVL